MLWIALVLGLIEGLTEFLPISSTGHLILASSAFGMTGRRAEAFAIFIQLGAVLAVVWEYRARLLAVARDLGRRAEARAFVARLFVAFVPSAVAGLLLHDAISEHLFGPRTVAFALLAGAALIFVVEALPLRARTDVAESTGWAQAAGIGLAQCLALWPGFSRSAATILGGMGCGLSRRAATEFSFFLAIPTLGAATVYDLAKNAEHLAPGDLTWLGLALVVSFLVAWATIRWLLRWVSTHTLRPFGWYRIVLGLVVLVAI